MILPNKKILILNGILLTALLAYSVYRDFQMIRQYPWDLRNRVVGSRLQKDGKLPYNYYWQTKDGSRYYDASNKNQDSLHASNITASPFFHVLLYPICDFSELAISRIWLFLEYFFLGAMIWMVSTLTDDKWKKWILLNVGILFTATEAWKYHIYEGQLYLFEAFLMTGILVALIRSKKSGIIFAAILAAVFVLTRPIAFVIFIPFLFHFKNNLLFLGVSFFSLALYGLFVLADPAENALYKNYFTGIAMQVQIHQHSIGNPAPQTELNVARPKASLEGFEPDEIYRLEKEHPIRILSENGNLFMIYYKITARKISMPVLYMLTAVLIVGFSILFYFKGTQYKMHLVQILLFGFILYMIMEISSPIHRAQYNTVQWFPMVLTGFTLLDGWRNKIFWLLILGLMLNICNFQWLLMRHTLGELCWLAAMLILVYTNQGKMNLAKE
jgi:hypothetical protein